MTDRQTLYEKRDGVALLTLNRPDKLNAWTDQMRSELVEAIENSNADPDIGAIVVTGAGRGFCAGADIEGSFKRRLDTVEEDPAQRSDRQPSDWVALVRSSKPMIAAINGVAVGVGITQVLPFDILLASTAAKVGMFFVRMGLVPELGSSHFLVQRVGFSKASEMCLTGRLYRADELEGTGFWNAIVEPDQLLDTAIGTAREIAANPQPSLRMIKDLLSANGSETDLAVVQRREIEALERAYQTAEHKEAVQAFMEKRKPDFRGLQAAEAAS